MALKTHTPNSGVVNLKNLPIPVSKALHSKYLNNTYRPSPPFLTLPTFIPKAAFFPRSSRAMPSVDLCLGFGRPATPEKSGSIEILSHNTLSTAVKIHESFLGYTGGVVVDEIYPVIRSARGCAVLIANFCRLSKCFIVYRCTI